MGGGKGGSDFDPVGKSDAEITRFCQASRMNFGAQSALTPTSLAGDVGVGGREIGYVRVRIQEARPRIQHRRIDRQGRNLGRLHPPS